MTRIHFVIAYLLSFLLILQIIHAWTSKRKLNIRYHLGTKTPYFTPASAKFETPVPPKCELVHINLVARHGVRNPQFDDIEKIHSFREFIKSNAHLIANETRFKWLVTWANHTHHQHSSTSDHADINVELDHSNHLHDQYVGDSTAFHDHDHLSSYEHHYQYSHNDDALDQKSHFKTNFKVALEGELVYKGELEHYHLAQRMKKKYYSDLSLPYYPGVYNFQSTQVPRCGTSANAFAFGLLENTGEVGLSKYQPFFVNMTSLHEDKLLRFFKVCKRYVKMYKEQKEKLKSPTSYFHQVLARVRRNIQSTLNGMKISEKHVKTLWNLCAFNYAVWGARHFCSLFSDSDILRMELANDVSDYLLKGYGNPLNYKMSCPLFSHIIGQMDRVVTNRLKSRQRANFMFAHAETIYPLTSLLGLFKDKKQLSMKCYIRKKRKWRSTRIAPFAANIAFLLYKCEKQVPMVSNSTSSICKSRIGTGADVSASTATEPGNGNEHHSNHQQYNNHGNGNRSNSSEISASAQQETQFTNYDTTDGGAAAYSSTDATIVSTVNNGEEGGSNNGTNGENGSDKTCASSSSSSSASSTSSNQQGTKWQPEVVTEYRVKLLHNEEEFQFPGCLEMYCPLEKVKELYDEYLGDKCNFEEMCAV